MEKYKTERKLLNYKVCAKCLDPKPIDDFGTQIDKSTKTGIKRHSWCQSCMQTYKRDDHLKHKNRDQEKKRGRITKNRTIIIEYLREHPCVDCGEDDVIVLDFDHVRGSKIGDVCSMVMNGVGNKALANEINKCEIRCSNCHRRKTAKEHNHWRVAMTSC